MIYKLTLRNLSIADSSVKYIDYHVKKLDRFLPNFSPDLPLLEIVIKNHDRKGFFDGSITLHLPGHPINTHTRSRTIDQLIKIGFEKIIRALKDYKARHFSNDSQYPKREKITGFLNI